MAWRRYLVIKSAWPSSMRTLSGDHERFETVYFKVYPGYYFTGDGCRRDKDGYYWLIGAGFAFVLAMNPIAPPISDTLAMAACKRFRV